MITDSVKDLLSIVASTYRVVVCMIPPLLRLGVIDQVGCVVLGAVIGIVVAIRAMHFKPD